MRRANTVVIGGVIYNKTDIENSLASHDRNTETSATQMHTALI